jgi:hypothetical protein
MTEPVLSDELIKPLPVKRQTHQICAKCNNCEEYYGTIRCTKCDELYHEFWWKYRNELGQENSNKFVVLPRPIKT